MKTIKFKEASNIVNFYIDLNQKREANGDAPFAVNLIGEAGIGKTALVREIAQERKMNFVKLNLAQLDEVGDLLGYPVKEVEVQTFKFEKDAEGKVKRIPVAKAWTTEAVLKGLDPKKYALTNKTRMSYAKPAWVPEYDDNGTILLLDDYTRCTPVFAQAIMDIIYEQASVSWKLPKKTTIVLTSNPDNGNYNVTGLDPAQGGRCFNYMVDYDEDAWAQWAERNAIDGRCISFALMYGAELFGRDAQGNSIADPRTYSMFCGAIAGVPDWEKAENIDFIHLLASGCFRDDKGRFPTMFSAFIQNKMHLLITPKQMLLNKWDTIKDKLIEQLNKDGKYNTGVASILERRFTNYVVAWLDSEGQTPINVVKDRILDFIRNDIFKEDLYYHMIKTITNTHKAQTGKLLYEPEISQKVI